MNDATTEYLNEMRYRMTERQSGYKGGEFFLYREMGMDLIYHSELFSDTYSLRCSTEEIVSEIIFIK